MGRTACTEPQYLYKGALYLFIHHVGRSEMNSKIFLHSAWARLCGTESVISYLQIIWYY